MHRNKKAQWGKLAAIIVAIIFMVIVIFIIKNSLGSSKSNLDILQSCEGQKGQCKETCNTNEVEHYKALGCGSGNYKGKDYCCIPQNA